MGHVSEIRPVLLVIAAFSRHDLALDWARDWAISVWGPLALESARFEFSETDYYVESMGKNLKKTFFAFEKLVQPHELPSIKNLSNAAEATYAGQSDMEEDRPLNLDPGYLTESKFILASTKDHAHRIYLHDGIFAEITLRYRKRGWQPWEWTYPDYLRADYQSFLTECRDSYREMLALHESS